MSDYLESLILTRILDGSIEKTTLDNIECELFTIHQPAIEWVLAYLASHSKVPSTSLVQRRFPDWSPVTGTDDTREVVDALREASHRTRLEADLARTIDLLYSDGPTNAISYIGGQLLEYGRRRSDINDLTDIPTRMTKYETRRKARLSGRGLGIPTGFETLDRWTNGGFQSGNYYLILGDTNVGKTWFSLYLAVQAWRAGYTPLYVSLEGAGDEPGYRFDSLVGHLSNSELFGGRTDLGEYQEYLEDLDNVGRPFWLGVQGTRAEYTPGSLWTQVAAKHPDIVFVDYLTLMTVEGEDSEDWRVASRISRTLATSFANRLNIPIVANAQGTRGSHGKSSLDLGDIGIAYAIVRPADMVMGLTPITGGLKVELLKGRHTTVIDPQGRRAKFYTATDWDVGEIKEDKNVLV